MIIFAYNEKIKINFFINFKMDKYQDCCLKLINRGLGLPNYLNLILSFFFNFVCLFKLSKNVKKLKNIFGKIPLI